MGDYYFISGYTGFCPDMSQRVGQNYSDSTRDAIRERPHLQGRLGGVLWREVRNRDVTFKSGDGYECTYSSPPSDFQSSNPCARDRGDRKTDDPRCPLKAHPLSCSDYGSPCLDKCCDDECCHKRYHNGENCKLVVSKPSVNYYLKQCHSSRRPSKPCCSSISSASSVCEGNANQVCLCPKTSVSCCTSCCKEGPCEGDCKKCFLSVKLSEACCNSCAKGGPCEEEKKQYSQCSSGRSYEMGRKNEASPSCYQCSFREVVVKPYRTCGVIPNYMGYIPGMHMTFGQPYGITANRLLRRHFSEQKRK